MGEVPETGHDYEMTDDEKAEAVQDGLAGVRRCPECGSIMVYISRSNGIGAYMIWRCISTIHCVEIVDESTLHYDLW